MFGTYKEADGFTIVFENGWSVSVRFGIGSFSDTRWSGASEGLEGQMNTSPNAELAIFFKGNMIEDVLAEVTTKEFAEISHYLATARHKFDDRRQISSIYREAVKRAGIEK